MWARLERAVRGLLWDVAWRIGTPAVSVPLVALAALQGVATRAIGAPEVAYAFALLLCGTPERLAEHPETRLRLTLGLRKVDGRWIVAHEHHSFADDTP